MITIAILIAVLITISAKAHIRSEEATKTTKTLAIATTLAFWVQIIIWLL